MEEYGKSLADYNKALELDPKNKEARQGRGDLYSKLKDPSKAVKDYELSMGDEKKKFDGVDYVNLGDKYKEANDFLHAIENYTKAIEMIPQFAHADHRFSAYNSRATVYMGQGEYDKALSDCKAGINLAKVSSDKLAEFWIREPEGTKEKIDCNKKLTSTPASKDFDTLTKRAFSYFAMDQYELALNEINEAIKLKPDYSSAYEKRQELLKIMYPNRDIPDIIDLMQQADSFMENKNYKRAVEAYTKILKAEPNYQDALFQRGRAYLLMKKYDLALTDYNKALELNPNNSNNNAKKNRQRVLDKMKK